LPRHISITLEHNPHANYYLTVERYLSDELPCAKPDFSSEYERWRCIDLNELWVMTWYPDNLVGSFSIVASNLESLLEFAKVPIYDYRGDNICK
jgi:hypothetical protein